MLENVLPKPTLLWKRRFQESEIRQKRQRIGSHLPRGSETPLYHFSIDFGIPNDPHLRSLETEKSVLGSPLGTRGPNVRAR